ncbi:PIR protein [Plasmodium yoelii]|uniref:PIR protein n=2 Tax=Plasmodium yoelii TaxID=5861 RepID=A0AAE9WNZ9_PLAYO|nr:PIR protein [Plasmodium yoelii]WBY55809.1 PIR protein [Plasmodium yoelii yoelii]CDU16856.1 YIR protein [Plasmodium yoelii]VTZ74538.1 PIR protein [Plasmodium yoelii]|eukprot:XP_022811729.1 PIR protein [Plasmodium yoelii]
MNDYMCRNFFAIRNSISDKLDNKGNYQIIIENNLNGYCSGNKCVHELEKINAGCLYLLDAFFKDSSVFNSVAKGNINIVDYIIIWLSYMLNLKPQVGNTSNLQYFYNTYIKGGDKYKKSIAGVAEYKDYEDLINKRLDLINMDMNIISKFYGAFHTLCMMYMEFDEKNPNCKKCSEYANEFVKKYKILKEDSNITKNSSCSQILFSLSNYYDNFKSYCNSKGGNCEKYPALPTVEKIQTSAQEIVHISEDTSSSSSITNKLFIVLSIFGAIAFFLGISYKYSLFGFRKRFKKQQIREKIKNIKKRMNH